MSDRATAVKANLAERAGMWNTLKEQRTRIAELESQLAAAEADAGRYVGLKNGGYLDHFVDPLHPCDEPRRLELIDSITDKRIATTAPEAGEDK